MDLNQLRALVRKRQKVAANKIENMRKQGVNLEGTRHDVRAPDERISRYTRKQLEALHKRVNAFNRSDSTNYVQLHRGVVTKQRWEKLLEAQTRFNSVGQEHYNSVKRIKLPGQDETIGQRDAKFRNANRKRTYGDTTHRPYFEASVNPKGVNGEKALTELTKDFNRRTTPAYLKKELAKGRYQLFEMLKATGDHDLMEKFSALSDQQFNVVWNYTNLATQASLKYENMRDANVSERQRYQDEQSENATDDLRQLAEWGATLFKKKRK